MFERMRRRPKNRVTGEQIVQINSIRIYYREYGSGPPLILIHGLSGSGRWWRRNINALAEHYHVYVVDLIGFGRSSRQEFALSEAAESLAEWMEYLGID